MTNSVQKLIIAIVFSNYGSVSLMLRLISVGNVTSRVCCHREMMTITSANLGKWLWSSILVTHGRDTRSSLRLTWRSPDVSDPAVTTSIHVTQPRPGASWFLWSCLRSHLERASPTQHVDTLKLRNISRVDVVAMSQKKHVQTTRCFYSLSVAACVTITTRGTRVCHVDGDGIVTAARANAREHPTPRAPAATCMTISTRVAVLLLITRPPPRY